MLNAFLTCYRRELWRTMVTPLASAMLIFYLLTSGLLTLTLGGFLDGNSASLNSLFVWQPWLFLFLGTALTMGTWAEEYRTGSAELLLTLPVPSGVLVWAKFAASATLLLAALSCTLPFPITCAILGSPDPGPMLTGYLACLLTGGAFLALGQCASAWSSSQFVSFLLAFVLGLLALLAGFRPMNLLLLKWGAPSALMHIFSTCGIVSHFEELTRGRLTFRSIAFFLALIHAFLGLTILRLRLRHGTRQKRHLLRLLFLCLLLFGALFLTEKAPWCLDCTADRLYTLDEGTLAVLRDLAPTSATFVYSQNHPEISSQTRRHATRILEMLREFARQSHGRLTLTEFYPEDTQEQDIAEAMGLLPQIGSLGDLWFLGVQFSPRENGAGRTSTLPYLDAANASSLEYQLVSALETSQRTAPRKMGLVSSFSMLEAVDPVAKTLQPAWWSIQSLQDGFEVVSLDGKTPIPPDLDVMLLVHAKELSPEFLESLIHYLDSGKGVFWAVDPLSRVESQAIGTSRLLKPSWLPEVIEERWGVQFDRKHVAADRALATAVTDSLRGLSILPTLMTLPAENLSRQSPVTRHLSSTGFFCSGSFSWSVESSCDITPLMTTTADSRLMLPYEAKRSAVDILADFQPDDDCHTVSLQIQEKGGARAILVADADWLHDSLCVNQTTDLATGQEKCLPLNDNAVFLRNALEFLCKDERFLTLRSRGIRPRTFTRLEALGKAAEKRIQDLDAESFQQKQELRARADALRQGKSQDDPELRKQLTALEAEEAIQQEQLKTRQRQVLFDLRHRLDAMERRIALWNLLLTPAVLLLAACFIAWKRRR